MKSPFKKLRDFAVSKHEKMNESSSPAEELTEPEDLMKNIENVESMKSLYEGLLTYAHVISGAAYDFSRSIQDMASHMMETFDQYMDAEVGNVFSMLAKVQFEISKFLDIFAAHVSQTIITPTKTMVDEIQQVQVMKELYDEKWKTFNLYLKDMPKVKPKSGKADHMHRLALAKEDFNEQAQVLNFRLQSVTQGQSRSLITQAARYHSAQMHLFRKGLASITAMEPVMRQLALEKNIDRNLPEGIVNDISFEDVHEEDDASKHGTDSESLTSSPTASLEPQNGSAETPEAGMSPRKVDASSKSAPIFSSAYHQKEISRIHEASLEALGQKKISMYALPSPSNAGQGMESSKQNSSDSNSTPDMRRPLLFMGKPVAGSTSQSSKVLGVQGTPAEQNARHQRKDEKPIPSIELRNDAEVKKVPKIRRSLSHSGSIYNKYLLGNRHQGDISSSTSYQSDPLYRSGPVSRSSIRMYAQNVSPPSVSPPQISELHKLPPPPSPNSAVFVAHSAPQGRKAHDAPPPKSGATSPLPRPPQLHDVGGGRSLSIPLSSTHVPEYTQCENNSQKGFPSAPLKPLVIPVTTRML